MIKHKNKDVNSGTESDEKRDTRIKLLAFNAFCLVIGLSIAYATLRLSALQQF